MRRLLARTSATTLVTALVVVLTPATAFAYVPTDRAQAAGIYSFSKTWAATPADYDSDGDEDVWVGYHVQGGGKLWSNDGDGTYTRVASSAWPAQNDGQGLPTDRHDCAWADVDLDGRPDSYCSAGRHLENLVKASYQDNELWLQRSPGVFTDVATQWGLGDPCGRGRHVRFLYANNDAYPDLFVGNAVPRKVSDPCDNSANGLPNEESKLFINTGGTGFRYAPEFIRFGSGPGQRCAEVLDYDGDGDEDLLACRFKNQTPRLYRNNGGTSFTEVGAARGLRTAVGDVAVVDYDGDGDPDLVTSAPTEFSYRLNNGGTFGAKRLLLPVTSGEGRSVAVGDTDDDGDLDVYAMIGDASRNPNDVVLVRNGASYTSVSVPPATGLADEVIALHPYGADAATSFLVLNGGNDGEVGGGGGPTQLIEDQP